jgi:hypothetical protein
MAIPVLAALLIHIIWLSRTYKHANLVIMSRVRAGAAIGSWIITTALFCLIHNVVSDLAARNIYLGGDSAGRQVVSVISSPDNSICYVEMRDLDASGN